MTHRRLSPSVVRLPLAVLAGAVFVLAAAGAPLRAASEEEKLPEALEAAYRRLAEAVRAEDARGVMSFYSPDFVFEAADGSTVDRGPWRRVWLDDFERRDYERVSFALERVVERTEDAATVRVRRAAVFRAAGSEERHEEESLLEDVWEKGGEGWQLRYEGEIEAKRRRAVEAWADAALPVRDGLELWLDAARAEGMAPAAGEAPSPLEIWRDASGRGRHVEQPEEAARPRLLAHGGAAVVRFDGVDDHLRFAGAAADAPPGARADAPPADLQRGELTVFVVAAPASNAGDFRAFLAANARGHDDYTSGMTLDQSAWGTPRFETLNVEGAGFAGARDLLGEALPFGGFHVLAAVVATGEEGVVLHAGGKRQEARPRAGPAISLEEITVGARYHHGPVVRGHLDGAIAEVIVYGRALAEDERRRVEAYLAAKHAGLPPLPPLSPPGGGRFLEPVADPPPVQVLVPGFEVEELPVDIGNINNVRYRPDGKLVALGYDGTIHLLADVDADGLEEEVEVFSRGTLRGPIGMALTPPGYRHGEGVFVASTGKLSLITDADGDERADREIVVASGWKPLPHQVDALGVAFDARDGSVYFGLGTHNFADAFTGYDLASERGTILRVAPDFSSREVVCTGIRFPVGLALNRAGDLFATDQEGATWLANGNPLDELLHILPGRHYGFPPRHPRHLPAVIDEPSLFDYGPQHQSTCGLQFNEPVGAAGPAFGPGWWHGDAFVAAYSRGKLYRTKLARTEAGYVARTSLLASLGMLAADIAVGPRGELVVAAHGGGPDWGSGPEGRGKLYKLTYRDRAAPQPVLAWAAGPREARVAFDRALAVEDLEALGRGARITYGRHVRAGDRFETQRPGYEVVRRQMLTPRFDLPLHSVQVTPDRRTLILETAPHDEALHHAVTLPWPRRAPGGKGERRGRALPQHPEVDLDYDLSGALAAWEPASGEGASGDGAAGEGALELWLPHLDLDVARELTRESAAHDDFFARLAERGKLTLRAQLDLESFLRPRVQEGSRLDHEPPPEEVTVAFAAEGGHLALRAAGAEVQVDAEGRRASLTARGGERSAPGKWIAVDLVLEKDEGAPRLSVSASSAEDARPRPLALSRILVPHAREENAEEAARAAGLAAPPAPAALAAPEVAGGDWGRGLRLFHGEEAGCARCHRAHGRGGAVGPSLENLHHRDPASVLRDITEPGYSIHPDFIAHAVVLESGDVLTGSVRREGEELLVGDAEGRLTRVAHDRVVELQALATSTMPAGLAEKLGPERLRDLLAFLVSPPLSMPDYGREAPPAPRAAAEVERVLAPALGPEPGLEPGPELEPPGAAAPAPSPPPVPPVPRPPPRRLSITLVDGPKDHGPGEHDYPAWRAVWGRLLSGAERVEVRTASGFPGEEDLAQADVIVFYQRGEWTEARAAAIDRFLARGGGLVYLHYAVDGGGDPEGFAARIGLAWVGGRSRFRHGPLELDFSPGRGHPVARGFERLEVVRFHDESYWRLAGDPAAVQVIASGIEDGAPEPLLWSVERGGGRVFVSILGHFAWTFDDPLFRLLVLRGIAWAAREPVDRLSDLVFPGARVLP